MKYSVYLFLPKNMSVSKPSIKKKLLVEEDPAGDNSFKDQIKHYNKINFKTKAQLKVTLYADTGRLSQIRFVRSSGISELDKVIADDITRWNFKFPGKKIKPILFEVSYYIFLKNEISREEAEKELKKYTQ